MDALCSECIGDRYDFVGALVFNWLLDIINF